MYFLVLSIILALIAWLAKDKRLGFFGVTLLTVFMGVLLAPFTNPLWALGVVLILVILLPNR